MTISKKYSPFPKDEGNNHLKKNEHKINSSAYKNYVAPIKKQQKFDLKNFDFEAEAKKLDSMDQIRQIKFLVNLVLSQQKTLARLENNQELLIHELIKSRVYSMMHSTHNQLMIGYSADFVSRRNRHEKAGWIYLGSRPGSQQNDEKVLKRVIKQFGISPVPASTEIFIITPELIELLINFNWVGIRENKTRILTKNPQLTLDLSKN